MDEMASRWVNDNRYLQPLDEDGNITFYRDNDPNDHNVIARKKLIAMQEGTYTEPPVKKRKGGHGGYRPGAGAPRRNTNAYKSGRHSRQLYKAALMLACVPELKLLFRELNKQKSDPEKARYRAIFKAAFEAAKSDPDLADEMEKLVYKRIAEQLAKQGFTKSSINSIKQSSFADIGRGRGNVKKYASKPFPPFRPFKSF